MLDGPSEGSLAEPKGSPEDAKAYMTEVRRRIDDVFAEHVKGRSWREAVTDLRRVRCSSTTRGVILHPVAEDELSCGSGPTSSS